MVDEKAITEAIDSIDYGPADVEMDIQKPLDDRQIAQ